MTKKTKKADSKRKKIAYGAGLVWVANNLSEEQLKHADEIAPDTAEIIEFMLSSVDAGLDIKVGWDDYSNCYQAVAIGSWSDFPSSGYAVSARSSRDVLDALVLVWYKVMVMAQGELSSLPSAKEEDDMRG